jgi:multidrug efflux pump subunit AcrA (membrane-fusion protein)
MTGVVTHVHAVQGAAVQPGELLFQIRLTHEDLVLAQTEFVKTLGELEVEQREISRLRDVTSSGAVAGKLLLEREYAKDKLEALLQAQQEALRLHGLSDEQVAKIAKERRLLREMKIYAPSSDRHGDEEIHFTRRFLQAAFQHSESDDHSEEHHGPLVLQQLEVHKGQSVDAGETLCVLADYEELFIEGLAFEQDVNQLRRASANEWRVNAVFRQADADTEVLEDLKIAYLANQVDAESRTLRFYVRLPNEITKDRLVGDSRYVEWNYLPGQRLQLRVPVEEWTDQIVLPVDAVAREGAESFVFQNNGDHFDRVPVHVKYRDQYAVVIDHDGSLKPGDRIAMRGAHQMQMALKNRSGGSVDPHAGHSH